MKIIRLRCYIVCAAFGLAIGATVTQARAEEPIEYDEAKLFLEENRTDGDLGLHFKVDGEGWKRLRLRGPDKHGRKRRSLFNILVQGNLGHVIGLTEIFSESAEPSFDELPRDEFLSLFPEGEYCFFGKTSDGIRMKGVTTLSHTLPDGAEQVSPEEDEEVNADEDLVIVWETVDDPAPPEDVVEFYEVVVEKDEDDELLRVFSVHMLPGDTTVRCPAEFLEAGKDYKVEIIVQSSSGNRTTMEVPFTTAD